MNAPAASFPELTAPVGWRTIEFISDLHLQAGDAATFGAWRRYMLGTRAQAVFILGDLFEAWPGDDAAAEPGFEADCAAVLRRTADARPVFFMHGNRDFLVGPGLLSSCGVTLLQDPTVLAFAGERWLLSHGDLLCLDDTEYLAFRAQVRSAEWRAQVLRMPLAQRRALARQLRAQSEAKQAQAGSYADVDAAAAAGWLRAADAGTLIHGHTHRPARHDLGDGLARVVLSDWDLRAGPPRAEVLRLDGQGAQRVPLA